VKIIFNNVQHVLTTSAPILGQSEKKKRERERELLPLHVCRGGLIPGHPGTPKSADLSPSYKMM
jgi:hypothetical protein